MRTARFQVGHRRIARRAFELASLDEPVERFLDLGDAHLGEVGRCVDNDHIEAGLRENCGCERTGRACADNQTGAVVVGLNVKQLYALTFGIGAACVGAAGCMLLLIFDVTPSVGPAYTLLAFVIVITGGLGSMPGAIVGGVLIGLTEAIAGLLFTPSAKSMFVFAILVIVLLVRPQGIMGKRAA